MRRRSFLGAILATVSAPAIVRADSLMRVYAPKAAGSSAFWTPVTGLQDFGYAVVYNSATESPVAIWHSGQFVQDGQSVTVAFEGAEGVFRLT
jgi:hypothetical protein